MAETLCHREDPELWFHARARDREGQGDLRALPGAGGLPGARAGPQDRPRRLGRADPDRTRPAHPPALAAKPRKTSVRSALPVPEPSAVRGVSWNAHKGCWAVVIRHGRPLPLGGGPPDSVGPPHRTHAIGARSTIDEVRDRLRIMGGLPKIRTPGAQTGCCARRRATIRVHPVGWGSTANAIAVRVRRSANQRSARRLVAFVSLCHLLAMRQTVSGFTTQAAEQLRLQRQRSHRPR